MHKKSIEASQKLQEEDEDPNEAKDGKDKEEIRSESIATLRAKAQQHSAKVMEALTSHPGSNNMNPNRMTMEPSQMPQKNTSMNDAGGCSLGLDLDCLSDSKWTNGK